jgi:tetratricopeptide (TPR) repeat protein
VAVTSTRRPDPDTLAGLEEQRDFLARSLDDLDRERAAGDLDEHDYETLRADYSARAERVRRAIDGERLALRPPPRRPWTRTAAVVVVVGLAAGGTGLFVATTAGSRLPGDSVTGDIRQTSNDRLTEAVALAQSGEVVAALEIYEDVLAEDPENVRALLDRGLLRLRAGQETESPVLLDAGRESIEQALAVRPDDAEALFYLALAQRLQGDVPGATATLRLALEQDPPPALEAQITDALEQAGQTP